MTDNRVPKMWQYTVLDAQAGKREIGIRFRQSRSGPEEDLVRDFLERFLERFTVKVRDGFQVTFFKEPQLESGAPDLVGVIWRTATAEKWNTARLLLQPFDIRVMHYLAHHENIDRASLENLFDRTRLKDALAKLEAADMVRLRGQTIAPRPLSKLYAAKHIFAIEAKITKWRAALNQAFLNRWFATSSYILLPRIPLNSVVVSQAQSFGVGVWSSDGALFDANLPLAQSSPVSYASWLFNEWAWRASIASPKHHAEF
jgi:hypothetical protein